MQISIGKDAEFIVRDKETGIVFPACLIFPPQNKAEKIRINFAVNHSEDVVNIYNDGRQGEFNISPQYCREWSQDQVWLALQYILKKVEKFNATNKTNLEVVFNAGGYTKKEWLKLCGNEAFIIGCKADYNAYNGGLPNQKNVGYGATLLVYSGSHFHFAMPDNFLNAYAKDVSNIFPHVKMMDLLLGLPHTTLFDSDEFEKVRKKDYGRAGCYRLKPYGIEYRTCSSSVLKSPELMSLFLEMCNATYSLLCNYEIDYTQLFSNDRKIQQAINEMDGVLARKIWDEVMWNLDRLDMLQYKIAHNSSPFYKQLISSYSGEYNEREYRHERIVPLAAFNYLLEGKYKFTDDVIKEWRLNKSFRIHGETAFGFIAGMRNRLSSDDKYRKYESRFLKGRKKKVFKSISVA